MIAGDVIDGLDVQEPDPQSPLEPGTPAAIPQIPFNAPPLVSSFCPAYTNSELHRPRGNTLVIGPDQDDWEQQIEQAQSGTEVLLLDGVYTLDKPEFPASNTVFMANANVTVRSQSGNSDAVIIRGSGYPLHREDIGFMVAADGITIADLTIHHMRDHATVSYTHLTLPTILLV